MDALVSYTDLYGIYNCTMANAHKCHTVMYFTYIHEDDLHRHKDYM